MSNKITLLFFIFLGLFIKSQEYKKYDFERQVRFIFNDSSYIAMEAAVTEYLPSEPYYTKYIEKEIVPLKFMKFKKNKGKKIDFDYPIVHDSPKEKKDSPIYFDFSEFAIPTNKIEKRSGPNYYFTSYTNDVDIKFKKNAYGIISIENKLKTFSIEKISTPYDQSIQISKKFSSKSHVFTDEFLDNCEKCNIGKIIYSNKTTVSSKNRKENTERLNIIVFDLVEKNNNEEPLLISRKVTIRGNKEEALDYLKKNKLDYQEVYPENIKEEDFKDLD